MSDGAEAALTLLSAPAGFGKTTLLAEWLATGPADGRSRAWLSLDRRDNDPAVFWAYVIAALDSATQGIGQDALSLLRSPQPSMEVVLATLINDLSALAGDVVLVLDDFHVIESTEVQDGMAFLLEHLPPQLHLVVASRTDPAMPLARMRGRGHLVEIRVADLRFTPDEAAAYLNGAMGLGLDAADVAALEGRTEGWIAALQLAALSMKGRDDIPSFIAAFAGDDRYIVDYLAEEVLERQPEHVRSFLLRTSVLSRLNGPLCDAVTGQAAGTAMLESLERGNLFLVPLDDRRKWYRYHHLFADVLRARLMDEQPDLVLGLHLRASDWFERNGEPSEAVHHALVGEDFERAADLIEKALPAMLRDRREATLCSWLDLLPEPLFEQRPVLSVGYVGALMSTGQVERASPRLQAAERWLDVTTAVGEGPAGSSSDMVVVDAEQLQQLPGTIEMYRAAQALVHGDPHGTVTHARRAIDLTPEGDHLPRAGGTALLALASWTTGDLGEAHRAYSESMAMMVRVGHASDVLGCALAVADIELAQGRLSDAQRTYERALEVTAVRSGSAVRGTADMHVGLSGVERERNNLPAATEHLLRSQKLGAHAGLPQNPYRWRVAMAQLRRAEGDLDGAVNLLEQAERVYTGDYSPDVRPIPAMRAGLHVARGALGDALRWVRACGVTVDDDLSYLHEFEHLTLARVMLTAETEHSIDDAVRFLDRLLAAAKDGSRRRSVIEISVVHALAHQKREDGPAAAACLRRALNLAQGDGYVRTFLDEGPAMTSLLKTVARAGVASGYARQLLAAAHRTGPSTPASQGLIDPLTERELEVLRLLATDLSGPDIAHELVVSLSTVRSHTKNIYAKLGVNNRRAAVRQGAELHLLGAARKR